MVDGGGEVIVPLQEVLKVQHEHGCTPAREQEEGWREVSSSICCNIAAIWHNEEGQMPPISVQCMNENIISYKVVNRLKVKVKAHLLSLAK